MEDLNGLVAVVTGGGSGIGAAIAQRLGVDGAAVAILDRELPPSVPEFRADVTDDASVVRAVAEVVSRYGRIDILVNNAGIGAQGGIEDNPDDEWHRVWDVNVVGLARVTRACLPHLRRSESAAIVNVASVVATVGLPQRALYSATKGAVVSLTRAMAVDLVGDEVRVNAVAPGTVDTPWIGRLLDAADDPVAARAALVARQPHGRLVSAAEVAEAVAYLASPKAGSTNAAVLAVDGGLAGVRTAGR